jgi:hypothetical protein
MVKMVFLVLFDSLFACIAKKTFTSCPSLYEEFRDRQGGHSLISNWRRHLLIGLVQTAVSAHLQTFGECSNCKWSEDKRGEFEGKTALKWRKPTYVSACH